ncbi:MAG: tetratricopeptide repeat protein, partial [bacterium]|nr:tetratricopeptide repeat protein [bacterium]
MILTKQKTAKVLLFFLLSAFALWLSPTGDSLKPTVKELQTKLKTAEGKEKVGVLNELSKAHYFKSNPKILEYGEKALACARTIGDKNGEAIALMHIGAGNYYLGDIIRAENAFSAALSVAKGVEDEKILMRALSNVGLVTNDKGSYRKALEYYLEALKLAEKTSDKRTIAQISNNIGNLYGDLENFDQALEYFNKALEAIAEQPDSSLSATISINIGRIYVGLN